MKYFKIFALLLICSVVMTINIPDSYADKIELERPPYISANHCYCDIVCDHTPWFIEACLNAIGVDIDSEYFEKTYKYYSGTNLIEDIHEIMAIASKCANSEGKDCECTRVRAIMAHIFVALDDMGYNFDTPPVYEVLKDFPYNNDTFERHFVYLYSLCDECGYHNDPEYWSPDD